MAESLAKQLIDAGVHYGHRASRWNPKMAPYIYARKNLIHIIDIRETIRGLLRARKFMQQVASRNGQILFVGTKRQASETLTREMQRCQMPYVSERWLGGTLTNFRTIRSRLGRLEELESILGSDEIQAYSKKMQSSLNREYRKMFRNLNGIRAMNRLPECLFVIDPRKEKNSIREAQKLGITTISLIDTDCDPDLVDLPIPGNDDGIRSIELVVSLLADAVVAGRAEAPTKDKDGDQPAGPAAAPINAPVTAPAADAAAPPVTDAAAAAPADATKATAGDPATPEAATSEPSAAEEGATTESTESEVNAAAKSE